MDAALSIADGEASVARSEDLDGHSAEERDPHSSETCYHLRLSIEAGRLCVADDEPGVDATLGCEASPAGHPQVVLERPPKHFLYRCLVRSADAASLGFAYGTDDPPPAMPPPGLGAFVVVAQEPAKELQRRPLSVTFHGTCYLCGERGHSQNYCSLAQCGRCGNYGHMARRCKGQVGRNHPRPAPTESQHGVEKWPKANRRLPFGSGWQRSKKCADSWRWDDAEGETRAASWRSLPPKPKPQQHQRQQ
ncbi:hypothetical protein [Mollivirus kamchatka]|nr:hypothetical protein [Mollivirus kamchatka]